MHIPTALLSQTPEPPATPEVTALLVSLPSGEVARVDYVLTVGDVFIVLLLMLLLALGTFALIRSIAHSTAESSYG